MSNVTYLNSGSPVKLDNAEKWKARQLQRQVDELRNSVFRNEGGFQLDITTLTEIQKSVTDQKFFQVAPADFLPVVVGQGAWADDLLKYRSFSTGGDFETGVINTGSNSSRQAEVDAEIDGIRQKIINWGKMISWSLIDLNMASRSGNWDLVLEKEKSRKKNWDLGIQRVAFLGLDGNASVNGLLTLPDVNSDTTTITKYIKNMTPAEFQAFIGNVLEAYRANCNRTAMPTHFIIPEADYNGLANAVDEGFPLKSRLERLLEAFKAITRNNSFEILPLAYADQAQNTGTDVGGKNRYVLLNYDEDSLAMNLPVDYNNTLAGSIDNFNYQNVGYGQFTGAIAYRPPEVLYLDWSA